MSGSHKGEVMINLYGNDHILFLFFSTFKILGSIKTSFFSNF
jgi:hypothetical protein